MRNVLSSAVVVLMMVVSGCCFGPKGPFCQSCAMPMDKAELFGTNADGAKSEEYCTYCFQNGQFTDPDITMQEMIDLCVQRMVENNVMPEDEARKLMEKYLPMMKRWRKK